MIFGNVKVHSTYVYENEVHMGRNESREFKIVLSRNRFQECEVSLVNYRDFIPNLSSYLQPFTCQIKKRNFGGNGFEMIEKFYFGLKVGEKW